MELPAIDFYLPPLLPPPLPPSQLNSAYDSEDGSPSTVPISENVRVVRATAMNDEMDVSLIAVSIVTGLGESNQDTDSQYTEGEAESESGLSSKSNSSKFHRSHASSYAKYEYDDEDAENCDSKSSAAQDNSYTFLGTFANSLQTQKRAYNGSTRPNWIPKDQWQEGEEREIATFQVCAIYIGRDICLSLCL